jgi:para-aminobenzoate synthetase component 1
MPLLPLALRRDPLDVLAALAPEPGAFLVEVPDPLRPVTLLGCAPRTRLRILADGRVEGDVATRDPLRAIEAFVAATPVDLPFPYGGAVGYLAYELGRFTEPRRDGVDAIPDVPLAVLARYDPIVVYDRARAQWMLACVEAGSARASWLERLAGPVPRWHAPLAAGRLAPRFEPERHVGGIRRVLDYVAAGDVYQVNLTHPFAAPLAAPAWALFHALGRRHAAPWAAYLDVGDAQIVSASPELFLRRRGERLETRPIKGTRSRGSTPARDAALVAELSGDAKERAEHVMIVDLERNDIGRVARPGSVAVDAFARVESHPTVHHLVSSVVGRLRPGVGLADVLRATFPGGSVTGAPKVRAMEVIGELEPCARGVYTGAFGLFHPGGDLELALAIRTAVVAGGAVRWGAGGGIVADSDPGRELAEAWLKTAALRLALGEDAPPALEQCSSG